MRESLHHGSPMSKLQFYLNQSKYQTSLPLIYSQGIKKQKYYYQSIISAQGVHKGAYKVGYNSLKSTNIPNTFRNMVSKVSKFELRKESNTKNVEEYISLLLFYTESNLLATEKEAMKSSLTNILIQPIIFQTYQRINLFKKQMF